MKPAMTAIEKGIEYIRAHGSARSPELAKVMGTKEGNIQPMLARPIEKGYLVSCRVEKPGSPPVNEYRLSAHVSESNQTWAEFKESNRVQLPSKALKIPKARPPREPVETKVVKSASPTTETGAQPGKITALLEEKFNGAAPQREPYQSAPPVIKNAIDQDPAPAINPPTVVFMFDTLGKLRIEVDGKTIICSHQETSAVGELLAETESLWR